MYLGILRELLHVVFILLSLPYLETHAHIHLFISNYVYELFSNGVERRLLAEIGLIAFKIF